MNGCDCRQYCNRARSRVSDLCKCQAGLADLATEYAAFIADLVGADTMKVTELVQHRALLGENQQQRKNERKAISKSFHDHEMLPAETITTREDYGVLPRRAPRNRTAAALTPRATAPARTRPPFFLNFRLTQSRIP
jgi:hypothetical protein